MKPKATFARYERVRAGVELASSEVEALEALVLACWDFEGPYRSGGMPEPDALRIYVEAERLRAWIRWRSMQAVDVHDDLVASLEDPNADTHDLKWAHRLTAEVLVVLETFDLLSGRAETALAKVRNRVGRKVRIALKRQRRRWPPDDRGALRVIPSPPLLGVPLWKGSDEASWALWIRVAAVAVGAAGLLILGAY